MVAQRFSQPFRRILMAEVVSGQESVLGADLHIKGTVTFEKNVRVHGHVEGEINGPGRVHLAKDGKINGDVQASEVVIEGDIQGDITASDRVEIRPSAHYEGNLRAAKLAIESGAFFAGHVSVGNDGKERAAKPGGNSQRPANAQGQKPEPVGAR
jgi:cytoskeletal protein CcmA (bactofilin family)